MSKQESPATPMLAAVLAVLASPMDEKLLDRIQGGPRRGAGYLPIHNAIKEANHVFGHGGWSCEILDESEVGRAQTKTKKDRDAWLVTWKARVRITAGGCIRDGLGVCESQPLPSLPAAVEYASVGAVSMATKAAFRTFGARFGLFLDQTNDPLGAGYLHDRYGQAQTAQPPQQPPPAASPAAAPSPSPAAPPPQQLPPQSQAAGPSGPPPPADPAAMTGKRHEIDLALSAYYKATNARGRGTLPQCALDAGVYSPGDLQKVPEEQLDRLLSDVNAALAALQQ